MQFPNQSRLTVRILVWVIGISVLMFSAVTVLTVFLERDRMYQAAQQDARGNVMRDMPAIAAGLWNFDVSTLNATLRSLTQFGSIIRAEVRDPQREVTAIERAETSGPPDSVRDVPIMAPDNSRQIGTLKISESYVEVGKIFVRNLVNELLSELAKIAGLAALLFLVIYRLITRHLRGLARQVSNLQADSSLAPVTLQRPKGKHDELDTLVDSINRFRTERLDAEKALLSDIAERNRIQTALTKSEIALSEALQIAVLAYWEYSAETEEFLLNDQYYSLHRTRAAEAGGYRLHGLIFFRKLIHPDDASTFAYYIRAALRASPTDQLRQIETRILCADGTTRWMLVRCKVERGPTGEVIRLIGASQDMTERRRAEDALRSAQSELARVTQLSTMGQMAASIAHEINQPLAAIVANGNAGLRWLANQTPNIDEALICMKNIVDDGHRAGKVINSIRTMFKRDGQEQVLLDINELIEDILALVQAEIIKQGVTVRTELTDDLPHLLANRVQLQQVILNLITNALDAMRSVDAGARVLRLRSEHSGSTDARIVVEDSGSGIDPNGLERIFEPFYTTKSNGMGMGLSICRSIVEAHGGRLSALSGIEHGSVFQIILPLGGPRS